MQPISADDPAQAVHASGGIRRALTAFADEVCATLARLFGYAGLLVLLGLAGVRAWDELQVPPVPAPEAVWRVAEQSRPAFALGSPGQTDKIDTSETYVILRHPEGGRKDVLRWVGAAARPVAELELYRPGGEYRSEKAEHDSLGQRMFSTAIELEAAGVIENTKFGHVALWRAARSGKGGASCLGFFKRVDEPALQISGWSCHGENQAAHRAAIDCMLDRLTLLNAGNEPKLGAYFAEVELRSRSCAPAAAADWLAAPDDPRFRGAL